jgi:hypothetical protein
MRARMLASATPWRNNAWRLWGPMIQQMRAKKTNQPPAPLLDHFDNIRVDFRNPTQHPDAEYDMNDAQNLLNVAVDAVARAVSAMDCPKRSGAARA